MMKIGNQQYYNRNLQRVQNNQVIFGLNKKVTYVNSTPPTKSCNSCIPPPSSSFDAILNEEQEQLKKKTIRQKELQKKTLQEKKQRLKELQEKNLQEKQKREKERREKEQRMKEQRVKEQREKERREKERREKEQRVREQRMKELQEKKQQLKELQEKNLQEKQKREKEQRGKEQREKEQREKEQREKEQREKEQREKEQREKEQREKEQREKEQREKEQREKEQREKEPPKEKELGEVFAESPTSVLTNDFDSRVMQSNKHVFLLFYAPWCGWCKRIAPDFIKATQELQGNSEVELMVVDATQHQIAHPKVQIQGFPTMFLFKKDDKANPVEYSGDRSVGDMVKFVNTHAGGKVEQPKQEPPKEKELGDVFAESPTSVLTNDFDSRVMQSNKHVLLLFYAPWCGWCKRIAPDFIKATQELQGNSEVELMVVDATQHQIVHPKVQIQGFPTVFLFKKDDKANPVEYSGDRSAGDMVKFVNTHASGKVEQPKQEPPKEKELGDVFAESPTSVLTNDFDSRVMQSNKHVLLLMYAPWCGWCKRIAPDFIKATQELQGNSEVELMVVDATQHQIVHPKVQLQGFPTVILFKKDDKANPVEYSGDRSAGDMVKFVNTHAGGKVEQPKQEPPKEKELGEVFAESPTSVLTNDFDSRVMQSNKHVLLLMYAPWCGWCKRIAPDFIKATQELQGNSEVELMVVDATQHQIVHPKVQLQGFPTVILFKKDDKANPVEYSGDRSAGDMVKFVNSQTNSPNIQLKVQEVSVGNGEPINITDNFKQLVVDSQEDVIVMFYAPWCGWCKKMLPDYDKLATHFKEHYSKLKIMKMDATAHQVQHENVKIYGFPLVHYFKAGDKQNPVEYKGNRTFDDMVNYINSNKTF